MPIAVKYVKISEAERMFPCIMSAPYFDKEQIILAIGKTSRGDYIGMNINGVGNSVGNYGEFCGKSFAPFHGDVILSSAPKEEY